MKCKTANHSLSWFGVVLCGQIRSDGMAASALANTHKNAHQLWFSVVLPKMEDKSIKIKKEK